MILRPSTTAVRWSSGPRSAILRNGSPRRNHREAIAPTEWTIHMDLLHFLAAWIRSPRSVGAVTPSSPLLAKAMLAGLTLGQDDAVIEFGPGTGPFTHAIGELLPKRTSYLGIDREPRFVAMLRQRFTGMHFVEGSAVDAPRFREDLGLGPVRAIICGLPFASLPPTVQDGVIAAIDTLLEPGAEFRTFQYVHAYPLPKAVRYRRRMEVMFGRPQHIGPIWRNLPPAFVLRWRR